MSTRLMSRTGGPPPDKNNEASATRTARATAPSTAIKNKLIGHQAKSPIITRLAAPPTPAQQRDKSPMAVSPVSRKDATATTLRSPRSRGVQESTPPPWLKESIERSAHAEHYPATDASAAATSVEADRGGSAQDRRSLWPSPATRPRPTHGNEGDRRWSGAVAPQWDSLQPASAMAVAAAEPPTAAVSPKWAEGVSLRTVRLWCDVLSQMLDELTRALPDDAESSEPDQRYRHRHHHNQKREKILSDTVQKAVMALGQLLHQMNESTRTATSMHDGRQATQSAALAELYELLHQKHGIGSHDANSLSNSGKTTLTEESSTANAVAIYHALYREQREAEAIQAALLARLAAADAREAELRCAVAMDFALVEDLSRAAAASAQHLGRHTVTASGLDRGGADGKVSTGDASGGNHHLSRLQDDYNALETKFIATLAAHQESAAAAQRRQVWVGQQDLDEARRRERELLLDAEEDGRALLWCCAKDLHERSSHVDWNERQRNLNDRRQRMHAVARALATSASATHHDASARTASAGLNDSGIDSADSSVCLSVGGDGSSRNEYGFTERLIRQPPPPLPLPRKRVEDSLRTSSSHPRAASKAVPAPPAPASFSSATLSSPPRGVGPISPMLLYDREVAAEVRRLLAAAQQQMRSDHEEATARLMQRHDAERSVWQRRCQAAERERDSLMQREQQRRARGGEGRLVDALVNGVQETAAGVVASPSRLPREYVPDNDDSSYNNGNNSNSYQHLQPRRSNDDGREEREEAHRRVARAARAALLELQLRNDQLTAKNRILQRELDSVRAPTPRSLIGSPYVKEDWHRSDGGGVSGGSGRKPRAFSPIDAVGRHPVKRGALPTQEREAPNFADLFRPDVLPPYPPSSRQQEEEQSAGDVEPAAYVNPAIWIATGGGGGANNGEDLPSVSLPASALRLQRRVSNEASVDGECSYVIPSAAFDRDTTSASSNRSSTDISMSSSASTLRGSDAAAAMLASPPALFTRPPSEA